MREIIDLDKQLFLGINKYHTEWMDPVMLFFSSYAAWGLVAFLVFVYILYTNEKARRWSAVCFLTLTVASTNLLNNVVKVIVARPRPIHEEAFTDLFHAIEKFDSSYSFFSAHSSSSFALAVFASLCVRKKGFAIVALLWAFVVAYSRIYVGKHYPVDVGVGILFGVLMAMFWWKIYKLYFVCERKKRGTSYEKEKNY